MTAASLRGVNAKLDQADVHFERIRNKVLALLRSEPFELRMEHDVETGLVVAKARMLDEVDFDEWATIIGDCVHNLRSAFDHLAQQLLIVNGGVPKPGAGGTAFPVHDTVVGPKGGPRTVDIVGITGSVDARVLKLIRMMQPSQRVGDEHSHPLWLLTELDNMDKHRELAPTFAAFTGFGVGIVNMRDVDVALVLGDFTGPIHEDTTLASWWIMETGPNVVLEVRAYGPVSVVFGDEAGPAAGLRVVSTLRELRDYARNVIPILWDQAAKGTATS